MIQDQFRDAADLCAVINPVRIFPEGSLLSVAQIRATDMVMVAHFRAA